ncbi:MAG: diacylglycerol kinase [Phycisphaerae bacterium]|nr:MAG: diacylglycerol kinase [Phycisphaerae bacterium]
MPSNIPTIRAIYNPIAGRRDLSAFLAELVSQLKSRNFSLEITPTGGPGDAARLAREAPDDTHAVMAVGGDGTCRDVASGLLGRPIPMIVAPAGNENILAKYVKSKATVDSLISTIVEGSITAYDVGTLNSNPFLLMAGVGFDAEAVKRVTESRKGHVSYLTYAKPLWQTFWQHRFPNLRVTVDDALVFEGQGLAFVGVMPRYAIGLHLLANAKHDDGLLDVCVMPCSSRRQLVGLSIAAVIGRHVRRDGVAYCKGARVQIESADGTDVPCQIDGDVADNLPIDCRIMPQAIRLMIPPGTLFDK